MNMKIKAMLLIIVVGTISWVCTFFKSEEYRSYITKNLNNKDIEYLINEYSMSSKEYGSKKGYVRDYSFEYFEGEDKEVEILLVGDSYFGSGNVFWNDSLAYKLYDKFDRKYSVRNLSIQNSSNDLILRRLESFIISEKFSTTKKYIIVLSVGLSDMFDADAEMPISGIAEEDASDFSMQSLIQKNIMAQKVNDLKILSSLFEFIYRPKFNKDDFVDTCSHDDITCAVEKMNLIKEEDKYELAEYLLLKRVLIGNYLNEDDNERRVNQLFRLIRMYPEVTKNDYVYLEILASTKLQRRISFSDVKNLYLENLGALNEQEKRKMDLIFSRVENWEKYNIEYENNIRQRWKALLSREEFGRVRVLQSNYFLKFDKLNDEIEERAKFLGIELLDLRELRQLQNSSEIVDDWSHYTIFGNDVVSQLLTQRVKDILSTF